MSQVFPYGIAIRHGGTVAWFPAVEVTFPTPDGERLTLVLLLDSGASISALPRGDAAVFGIRPEEGESMDIGGISGEILRGWRHVVTAHIGDEQLTLPVVFLDAERAPRVLGREGVFDHFTIVIEERQRRNGCIDAGSSEGAHVRAIMDSLRGVS